MIYSKITANLGLLYSKLIKMIIWWKMKLIKKKNTPTNKIHVETVQTRIKLKYLEKIFCEKW